MFADYSFWGLSGNAWFTLILILGMLLSLIFTKIKTWLAFMVVVSLFYLTGVLNMEESFSGFSSSTVLLVAVLFVVVAGLTYTGVLQLITKYVMGTPKTLSLAIARLMTITGTLSAFLNNALVVALFIQIVKDWSKKLNIAPSKLLIPLSYASGMGGICTLIGTAPNILISGMYMQDTGDTLSIFATTGVGLTCMTVGILSMIALQRLLPVRECPTDKLNYDGKTTELQVPAQSHLIGSTLQDAGFLEEHPNHRLLGIVSYDGEVNVSPNSDDFILGNDTLIYCGEKESILGLAKTKGLKCSLLDMDIQESQGKQSIVAMIIMIAMVVVSALGYIPLLQCAFLAAGAMLVFRCCTANQAFSSINLEILIIFACSTALGTAIKETGIAELISSGLIQVCGTNPYVVLAAICFTGTFITEFISNTACAAMFYPIAMSAATACGANPLPFAIALMIAVSSSFATPIGSPTHMLVYIPGGYKFFDFARIGVLMNIIMLVVSIFITTLIYPF